MYIPARTKRPSSPMARRDFLRGAAGLAGVATLAGCVPVSARPPARQPAALAETVPPSDPAALPRYAELLIRTGVNLQPHQGLMVSAQLAHAPLVRQLLAAAYQAGASYVYVAWDDTPSFAAMLANAELDQLELPDFEVDRYRYVVDNDWALLALTGEEFPAALAAVDPDALSRWSARRAQDLGFYRDAVTTDRLQWCVAGGVTPAWAQQVFPDMAPDAAAAALWTTILRVTRADEADPAAAWAAHDRQLQEIVAFLAQNQVRSLHFVDPAPGPDGKPATDLEVGLVEAPVWVASLSQTPAGVQFHANIPTEEVFTMPHNQRTHGYVRTSRPVFPLGREVRDGWFRFVEGELVDFTAAVGADVLEQYFAIDGARRLGEVALVDAASPVFQSGLVFYDTLFDENAACHIAFGNCYPYTMAGGDAMRQEELAARGANFSATHDDFMVGTPTMNVTGLTADGRELPIMEAGHFAAAATTCAGASVRLPR